MRLFCFVIVSLSLAGCGTARPNASSACAQIHAPAQAGLVRCYPARGGRIEQVLEDAQGTALAGVARESIDFGGGHVVQGPYLARVDPQGHPRFTMRLDSGLDVKHMPFGTSPDGSLLAAGVSINRKLVPLLRIDARGKPGGFDLSAVLAAAHEDAANAADGTRERQQGNLESVRAALVRKQGEYNHTQTETVGAELVQLQEQRKGLEQAIAELDTIIATEPNAAAGVRLIASGTSGVALLIEQDSVGTLLLRLSPTLEVQWLVRPRFEEGVSAMAMDGAGNTYFHYARRLRGIGADGQLLFDVSEDSWKLPDGAQFYFNRDRVLLGTQHGLTIAGLASVDAGCRYKTDTRSAAFYPDATGTRGPATCMDRSYGPNDWQMQAYASAGSGDLIVADISREEQGRVCRGAPGNSVRCAIIERVGGRLHPAHVGIAADGAVVVWGYALGERDAADQRTYLFQARMRL
ncbi:MAG TPA: hypothetical protein PKD61_06900 [Polyangiaceae bacterium]|nr:hypothetical protein [Polyangiaceae bacterium]